MAPIGGRPFLDFLLGQLRDQGYSEAVLCLGHMAHLIEDRYGDGGRFGLRLRYSIEEQPVGTAGALRLALPVLDGDEWLVLNGDSYFGVDLTAVVAARRAAPASTALALRLAANDGRYGSVVLGPDGSIVAFREKEAASNGAAGSISEGGQAAINAGVYALGRELVESIPSGRPVSLERETFPALVGHGLVGVLLEGPFIDIGLPHEYHRLERDWQSLLGPPISE